MIMIKKAPKSILQIHYHNAPGGVTKVIHRYSEISNSIWSKSIKRNLLVCCNTDSALLSRETLETIHLKECKYHTFQSKESFNRITCSLVKKLQAIISGLPQPVYVIGHNLSLGKNIALSAAFKELSEQIVEEDDVRFFSVIHDLAEEGRITLMQQIGYLESLDIPVWQYLYPQKRVLYVVLNKRNYALFTRAGFPTVLLPNPLTRVEHSPALPIPDHQTVTKGLMKLAQNDKTHFNPSAATLFYPVRVISRKNVLEAIIMTCLIHNANLLIGGYGTSYKDRNLFERMKSLSQRYRLPVVFDIERLQHYLPKKRYKNENMFSLLYRYSDGCISTSIGEGFGYALFEPWLYSKAVIGRLPLGISSDEIGDLSHLYSRFEIPVSWIPVEEIAHQYYSGIQTVSGPVNKRKFDSCFRNSFIKKGLIDFGVLTQRAQFQAFKKFQLLINGSNNNLCLDREAGTISEVFELQNLKRITIRKNRDILRKALIGKAYDRRFKLYFMYSLADARRRMCDRHVLIKYFSSLNHFRVLMTTNAG